MKLPNHKSAFVEDQKIIEYLLSDENSGGKAAFFFAFGFTSDQPDVLRIALLNHAMTHDVTRTPETPHGFKYIIEGVLLAPNGRTPNLRTVWIVDTGKNAPRLVTAYPV